MSLISQLFRRLGQEIPKVRTSQGNLERYCGYLDGSIPNRFMCLNIRSQTDGATLEDCGAFRKEAIDGGNVLLAVVLKIF